jgi:hypothetical protein
MAILGITACDSMRPPPIKVVFITKILPLSSRSLLRKKKQHKRVEGGLL